MHRGVEVTGLEQDADGVVITARPKDDDDPGHQTTWRAAYVIGADGAHSTVRGLLGLGFPGREVLSSVVLADVRLAAGPPGPGLTLSSTPEVFGFLVPYGREDADGGWYRSMTWDRRHQVPDGEPVGDDEIIDVLNRALGRDAGVTGISWRSRFHCEERQVTRYRAGRVFLAGDAAHVHSPIGGQGMNTGIQDAANLAWKLDAVLAGASGTVLDTFHTERHPVGHWVLLQSGLMMRSVTLHPRAARWLRDRLAPSLLALPVVRDAVAGSFAGTELRYPHDRGEHPLVGTRATDVQLMEGKLTEIQREADWVLVCGRREAAGEVGPARVTQARRADDGPALLVRPDGYIAWAGPACLAGPADPGWRTALARWTGDFAPAAQPGRGPVRGLAVSR